MNTIKKIIIVIGLTLCHMYCPAQQLYLTPSQDLAEHQKRINTEKYIFEGTVIYQKCYYKGHPGGEVFTCSIMKIAKIYKGSPQIELGTIKVITEQGGQIGNDINNVTISDGPEGLRLGGTYVIFGMATTFQPADSNLISTMTTDNFLAFVPFDQIDIFNVGAQWDFAQFKTVDSLYSFFKENGLTVQQETDTNSTTH